MRLTRLWLGWLVVAFIAGAAAYGSEVVTGTLLNAPADSGAIRLDTERGVVAVKIAKTTKVLRGQIGESFHSCAARELAPGDRVVAVVDAGGLAASIKSYYGRISGFFASVRGRALVFRDGRSVKLAHNAEVMLAEGKLGTLSQLKPGSLLVCRVNPFTNEAWTVVSTTVSATRPADSPVQSAVPVTLPVPSPAPGAPRQARVVSEAPRITSVTFTAPQPVRPGSLVSVEMTGTPNAAATVEIAGLVSPATMVEPAPGKYQAVLKVPSGKLLRNAAVVGRLVLGKSKSAAVQASRLITVSTPESAPPPRLCSEKPMVTQTNTKPPVSAAPSARAPIVITSPLSGTRLHRALLVRGTADPDAKVMVVATYTNNRPGVLNLSGQVCSQLAAVGKNGEFSVGPVALEGPLATGGLWFTIKVHYPDESNHAAVSVVSPGESK